MNKKGISLLLVGIISAALVYIGISQFSGDVAAAPSECRMQGAWVSSFAGGPWDRPLIIQETISPQDPAGMKLTYVMRPVNPDATFGFPFPPFSEAEYISELIGEATKTGPDTYDISLIGYGAKNNEADRDTILYIWTVNGTMTCIDGENKTDMVYLSVYEAAQDADSDGFPDEGEEPVFCLGPMTLSAAKRVTPMPACVPPPLEENQ